MDAGRGPRTHLVAVASPQFEGKRALAAAIAGFGDAVERAVPTTLLLSAVPLLAAGMTRLPFALCDQPMPTPGGGEGVCPNAETANSNSK